MPNPQSCEKNIYQLKHNACILILSLTFQNTVKILFFQRYLGYLVSFPFPYVLQQKNSEKSHSLLILLLHSHFLFLSTSFPSHPTNLISFWFYPSSSRTNEQTYEYFLNHLFHRKDSILQLLFVLCNTVSWKSLHTLYKDLPHSFLQQYRIPLCGPTTVYSTTLLPRDIDVVSNLLLTLI